MPRHPTHNHPQQRTATRFLVLTILLTCFGFDQDVRAVPRFPNPAFPVGSEPWAVVSADFNRDGIADLVVTNIGAQSSEISVLLGRGDGTFLPETRYISGDGPHAVAVGDFNADGRVDLAVANIRSHYVSIFSGVGDGTFGPATLIGVGSYPDSRPAGIVAGDWNRDSRLDLAVATRFDHDPLLPPRTEEVSILLGVGDGTFAPATNYPSAASPNDIVTADFNADGKADLAVTDHPDEGPHFLLVHLGNGDGTFGPAIRSDNSQVPVTLAVGDMNGDGLADVATANGGFPDDISVFIGTGDGRFKPRVKYPLQDDVNDVALADLDGDGDLDLAALTSGYGTSQGTLSIRLGSGNGTFGPVKRFGAGVSSRHLTIGNFSGDGLPDIAVTVQQTSLVVVLFGLGGGDFGPQERFQTGANPRTLAVGDFDANGHLDLAVANASSVLPPPDDVYNVSVLLGVGDGSFRPEARYLAGKSQSGLAVADFNADGRQDLAAANQADGDISVLLGLGDGTFGPQTRFPAGNQPACIVPGDLNGDGREDLVICNGSSSQTVTLLFGAGNGSFGVPVSLLTQGFPSSMAIADVTGDGLPDLLITAGFLVELRRGLGGGSFGPSEPIATGLQASLIVRDLNGDGRLDLAARGFSKDVCTVLGRGDGTFASPRCFPAGHSVVAVTAGDIDGDGTQDLVAVNSDGFSLTSYVSLYPGDGLGALLPFSRFLTGNNSTSVAAADFNEDGGLDLALTSSTNNEVWILPNLGTCVDVDGDGFSRCLECNDSRADVYPGAHEVCDGVDQDCDGLADEGLGQTTCGVGACARTVDSCVGGVPQTCTPGQPAIDVCDGIDNDCNGVTDDRDADGDGSAVCADCDEGNPKVHPGAAEICNGADENCNGLVDDDGAGVDSDGDTVRNACDNCRFAYNPTQVDTDHDAIGNACDNCVFAPNPGQADLDADQRGDACDNCPVQHNPFQDDFDADTVGDVCDNCPFDGNPDQGDVNNDFEGNVCDLDDGLIWITLPDASTVAWQQETGFESFNWYRGDLSVLRQRGIYTQDPNTVALAMRVCDVADGFVFDGAEPAAGEAVFFLVSGNAGGVESSLGSNSAGTERPNTNPCP